ncbi:hypothetical protein D9758_000610 [Tetrapyrgos nigripes]|uniref:CRA domain-containing protein n=1 Tax=Tetrapyrgos nigripes TaxID=182062 RepID=A0A8H5LYB4_9AGAR|nr:hypothetical protein D9758_000610 [Tetrapyrgos nigripes]
MPPDIVDKSHLSPYHLRAIVLDYLSHSGYTNTARAFLRDSTIRHLDMDGEEVAQVEPGPSHLSESTLKQTELRNQIRLELLSGRVDEATNLLNKYFPSVLSLEDANPTSTPPSHGMDYTASTSVHPAHLNLNLRIQAFIEACRTRPLHYPPSTHESTPDPQEVGTASEANTIDQQTNLLNCARKLYAYLKMLPSKGDMERYTKELETVTGLLAYKVPEDSSVSGYLEQWRREAVADQINGAILYHSNLPPISQLEFHTRYNSTAWSLLHELKVKPRPEASLPPTGVQKNPKSTKDTEGLEFCPPFDLQEFLDNKS